MEYKLPEETINRVLAYLGKQPYEEVWVLIAEIKQNAQKVGTIQPVPKKVEKKKEK